jgi:uncharacterized cupin superfamily protein
MDVVNLHGDEWDRRNDRDGWRWQSRSVGRTLGADRIGGSLYELEPGQRTFPYHWHNAIEEWLIVVSGTPTLRGPEGDRRLEPGDTVVFPRGPRGAHQVRNDTEEPVRVLIVSSHTDLEIAVYPDSSKIGVSGPVFEDEHLRLILPTGAQVDYFHGEE